MSVGRCGATPSLLFAMTTGMMQINNVYLISSHGVRQGALFRLLRAYAAFDADVRYTQGMSTLAAVLYLVLQDEPVIVSSIIIRQFNPY